ncbi:MAG TPA: 6,7-dimethyl-8-ribityllumazine synthase [Chitinophagales bacterium]|nr:6,7-dimethyl-8-ribityllumazine synthase [Chitinophagales bacterium]MCB9075929.1 6,7-dimethyl-8-ribityllumazine synthase [Chitinophagales bacterium]HMU97280.1 6,7-dimethyl-8-ribityllumazine synthase [Chitinophagales bacterium]HMV03346.1 6,7-dimethyl-8-ribityllumazine synthase [Chitinophagales bacterium]HMW94695.1 6,7-dimethyl-8-ribityllumazine synthase [Chitinophagales bacterium]
MASVLQNLSNYDEKSVPSGKGKKIGIAVAEWNKHITFSLLSGCTDTLTKFGVNEEDIEISIVPGTFELPYAAKQLYDKNMNAVICIGCVIKGETDHDVYINYSVANALQNLNIQYNIPFIFGVLTPNNEQQALDRAGGKHGNKGTEAAITALKMMQV